MVDGEEFILELGYGSVFTQLDEWNDAGRHAYGVGNRFVLQRGNGISYGFLGSSSKRISFVCRTTSIVLETYSILMVLNYENNAFVLQQVVN